MLNNKTNPCPLCGTQMLPAIINGPIVLKNSKNIYTMRNIDICPMCGYIKLTKEDVEVIRS